MSGEELFEKLLRDVVDGTYAPGMHLPSERELAASLGASRPTVREALRRLMQWRLVEAQRGSGIEVRPRAEWSIAVLPAYLRYGGAARDPQQLALLVRDLLALRRGLVVNLMRVIPARVKPGALDAARAHVERAWGARRDVAAFVRHDLEAIRAVIEAAQFLPALWLMSELAGVYESIAEYLTGPALAPADYVATHRSVFDALERGRGEDACRTIQGYLERHDQRMLAGLGLA